ncbi:C-factor-like [Argiope bruennichi]|uniref:C-factor like protein n=1 Tax=Argiope bruennichi TaxID=94029 RepID=A0A8T0EGH0_ARGBR|nr:C-factor-like [Argiope bruennichi]KAF8772041.1 C-factor like protein [Argiope bruennichi]
MKIESVLVTGANRGIGLEFVRQLSQLSDPPSFIFATYRNTDSLQDLKEIEESSKKSKLILIKMDVTRPEEIEVAKKLIEDTVGERGLNLLINNAGVAQVQMFPNVTPENLEFHFKVNTEGPLLVLQAMLPSLEKAAQLKGEGGAMSASRAAVLNMTSMAGSITNAGVVFTEDLAVPSYKISKAALNMAMRVAAAKVKDKGVLIVMMCPGWVKTDMGDRSRAILEPEESIADMLKTLSTLNESHHGSYMDRLGNLYPF